MEKMLITCTCDDQTDEPCPAHQRENEQQDRINILQQKLEYIQKVLDLLIAQVIKATQTAALSLAEFNKKEKS